jgi:2-polyprenyl-3-methyl-5-hydroxy-6-metoxy-1,4-benzoquinol methylase
MYQAGWPDAYDDPVSRATLALIGDLAGRATLDLACGHGRMSRELARRGATVVGVDLSASLIAKARALEDREPLGIHYQLGNASDGAWLGDRRFDLVTCGFGLSDIDDLDGALDTVSQALRPGGRFVWSILHPCFPGGPGVSGSWPSQATYWDEGRWHAQGEQSVLRQQVGATHRTIATYLNAMSGRRLVLDELREPHPGPEWTESRPLASAAPLYLVARHRRS